MSDQLPKILVEPEVTTTAQSLDAAVEIVRRMDMHSCIVVSDGYHIYRSKRILEAQHIQVYGSPRPGGAPASQTAVRWLYFKQAVGFALWQLGLIFRRPSFRDLANHEIRKDSGWILLRRPRGETLARDWPLPLEADS